MATRPTKTGGNQTYTAEVAAGQTVIKATEVDGDLNEIYANITNVNVASGAAIATSKLANDAGITAAKLATDSVTTAKIAALNVTTAKLALGASINALVSIAATANQSGITTETDIAVLPAITTRGGRVLVFGTVSISAVVLASVSSLMTLKLYRGVTVIATITHKTSAAGAGAEIPLPCPFTVEQPAAGTYVYKLTATAAAGSLETSAAPGVLFAAEFA